MGECSAHISTGHRTSRWRGDLLHCRTWTKCKRCWTFTRRTPTSSSPHWQNVASKKIRLWAAKTRLISLWNSQERDHGRFLTRFWRPPKSLRRLVWALVHLAKGMFAFRRMGREPTSRRHAGASRQLESVQTWTWLFECKPGALSIAVAKVCDVFWAIEGSFTCVLIAS